MLSKKQNIKMIVFLFVIYVFFSYTFVVSAEEKNYGWTMERYVNGEKSWDSFSTGDSVELSVKINNFPVNDLTYEWYHGHVDRDADKVGNLISVQEKGNSSLISIIKNAESYETYTCAVQMDDEEQFLYFNIYQRKESSTGSFYLEAYINNEHDYDGDGESYKAILGKDYKLGVNVISENQDEQYKFSWYNDLTDTQVCDENGQPYTGSEIVVTKNNNGEDRYYVVVENSSGVKKERSFYLHCEKENTIDALISINDKSCYDTDYISDSINDGENVRLKVDVICSPSSDISYEWRNNSTIINGADQNTYDLKFSGNWGNYTCTVKSGDETQIYTFWLSKTDAFTVSGHAYVNGKIIEDSHLRAKAGDVVKLCIDSNFDDVKYEWYTGNSEEEDNPLLSSDSFYTFVKADNIYQESFVCKISNGVDEKNVVFYVSLEYSGSTETVTSQVSGSMYVNGEKQKTNSSNYEIDSIDDLDDMRLEMRTTSPNEIVSYKWYQLYGEGHQYYLARGKVFYLTKDIMEHAYSKKSTRIACRVKEKNGAIKSYFVDFRLKNYTDEAKCYIDNELTNEALIPEGDAVTLKILPEDAKQNYVYEWYDFTGRKLECNQSELTIRKNGEFEGYYCKLKCGDNTTKYRFFLYSDKQYMIQKWVNDERILDASWDSYSSTERVEENKESKLEVKVFPDNGNVLYQWYKNGERLNETNSCIKSVICDDDEFKCIVKGDNLSKIIRFHFYTYTACDHKEVVTDEAVSPTCEADGLSEGSHCGKCGMDLVEQKPLKATGHKWDNGVVTKDPTVSEFGIKLFTCKTCHKTYETQIPKATGTTSNNTSVSNNGKNNTSVSGRNKNNVNTANGNTVLNNNSMYKITGVNTVEYKESLSKTASVSVPGFVTINGVKYQVTSIAPKAFKNNKKLKKIIIPASVKSIGKEAFCGCKNLRSIIIKTKLLTTKSVGKNAFRKAGNKNYKKLVVKVPKSKKKSYTKLLRKKGLSSAAKIK